MNSSHRQLEQEEAPSANEQLITLYGEKIIRWRDQVGRWNRGECKSGNWLRRRRRWRLSGRCWWGWRKMRLHANGERVRITRNPRKSGSRFDSHLRSQNKEKRREGTLSARCRDLGPTETLCTFRRTSSINSAAGSAIRRPVQLAGRHSPCVRILCPWTTRLHAYFLQTHTVSFLRPRRVQSIAPSSSFDPTGFVKI